MIARATGPGRPIVRVLAIAALAASVLLAPAGAAPVEAADDALSLVSSASYTLVPDRGLVHVSVTLTARNNKPNRVQETPQGTLTTRYFYEGASIVLHAEATSIRASAGKTRLTTKVVKERGYAVVDVRFAKDLYYKESTSFALTYDLPGGAPRSDSDIRVGSAFATFYAWAFGDSGDVRIVIPAGFEVETTGSSIARSVANGVTTLAASDVGDVANWFSIVVADRHDALTSDRLDLADGEHLVVRAWPEDKEWRTRVGEVLRRGLPVLAEKIGLDWPLSGDIEVAEVHTPLLEGYAGVFYSGEDRIEISEDLDELTIIHEASHAWFNSALFAGRWIDEGFADEYASRVLDEVSDGGLGPDRVAPGGAGSIALNDWVHPGRIDDAETDAREHYGYEASWTVVRALVDEIGEERMRAVLAAADARQIAYHGAGERETISGQNDWRRFLDLLEEAGGSAGAEALFRRWVVGPADARLLDARGEARTAYAALVAAGNGWQPGYAVRDPLGRWDFPTATTRTGEALAILDTRDEVASIADGLGIEPPVTLREAYEGAIDGLDSVRVVADEELAAVTALADADRRVAEARDPFTALGLVGETPESFLTAAKTDFAAGDLDGTAAEAARLSALVVGAGDVGRTRALGGALGVGLVAAGAGAAFAVRRRRQASSVEVAVGGQPYATLGDPPSAEEAGDAAPEPADLPAGPGPAEGDDT